MRAHLVAAKDIIEDREVASMDPRPPTRPRTEKERAYRKRSKKARHTNKGRKARKDNFCRRAVNNKTRLLEEPGWVSLRKIMRHINQTGPGMRLLHRYRSGDIWNDFGSFMRAFEPFEICTQEELDVREHNYRLHRAAIDRHVGSSGSPVAASVIPAHEEPDYLKVPVHG